MPETKSIILNNSDVEEFWDDLLAFIEDGRVIPVVGAELHTIIVEGKEIPLYRALAAKLLKKYDLIPAEQGGQGPSDDTAVVLRPYLELNDAVCALAQRGRRIQDLYRPINDMLRSILDDQPIIPEALRDIARIPNFDLFVSTTFDDLLVRALNDVRSGGANLTEEIAYAPNLPRDQARDIPERDSRPSNYHAVFFLFGRASSSPFYAIHDEDILEYLYNLLAGRGILPERMLAEIRSRNLLLIGCNFSDWLSRFFIRHSNQVRLSGDRAKREFIVDNEEVCDYSLTLFLKRFSQNTRVYPYDARSFIGELVKRWDKRHPQASAAISSAEVVEDQVPGAGDIFISYSHTDLAAAKILFSELAQIGAGVIWFDKGILKPGDEWKSQIIGAIRRCALFIPLLSSTAESRTDGFFRREWEEATERSKEIQGRKFILPVVVDPEFDGNPDNYQLKPDRFCDFQFSHAPTGHMNDELRQTIIASLRDLRRRRAS